ncbi:MULTISPECIES: hypothetical protein [Frankia]|uniref:hypothetical protein n=1 Tax=Frankia TaxID=1854 RepID=UPI0012FF771B|nr:MULTISPECIES: hypothetical protein [Frankia]
MVAARTRRGGGDSRVRTGPGGPGGGGWCGGVMIVASSVAAVGLVRTGLADLGAVVLQLWGVGVACAVERFRRR